MDNLGFRVKEIRTKNKLTQQQFGEQLGISQTHVSKIEKNIEHPSETLLKFIAYKYVVNIDWLKKGEGNYVPTAETSLEISMLAYNKARCAFEEFLVKLTNTSRWSSVYSFMDFVALLKCAECLETLDKDAFLEDLESLLNTLCVKIHSKTKLMPKDGEIHYERQSMSVVDNDNDSMEICRIIEQISKGLKQHTTSILR